MHIPVPSYLITYAYAYQILPRTHEPECSTSDSGQIDRYPILAIYAIVTFN